ncbi:hypothetical protein DAKH74_036760 [Maudiozyma humilis]|uniref:Gem-associated protein 2 n=1 Tax=Maudiozyma humilis TaxID=51915 RepID=A0AAV5S071_MAUHU|nr:hypothetical protein DAKH74_036760 [Kazachstania humilis]
MSSQDSFHTPLSTTHSTARSSPRSPSPQNISPSPGGTASHISDSESGSDSDSDAGAALHFTAGPSLLSDSDSDSEDSGESSQEDTELSLGRPAAPLGRGRRAPRRVEKPRSTVALRSFDLGGSFDGGLASRLEALRDVQRHATTPPRGDSQASPTGTPTTAAQNRRAAALRQLRRDTGPRGWAQLEVRPPVRDALTSFTVSRRHRDWHALGPRGKGPVDVPRLTDSDVDRFDSLEPLRPVTEAWADLTGELEALPRGDPARARRLLLFVLDGRVVACPELPPTRLVRGAVSLLGGGSVTPAQVVQQELTQLLGELHDHKWAMWYRAASQLPGLVAVPLPGDASKGALCTAFDVLVEKGQWEAVLYYVLCVVLAGGDAGARAYFSDCLHDMARSPTHPVEVGLARALLAVV